ncbi:MAG TPA: hypothetical protein VFY29_16745 [Terriglobia bacterium]|nr:hypothetical protein [Terriglobia bacterium]
MKATIEFDDELYRQLKAVAALRGQKLRELVEEGVRMVLQSPRRLPMDQPKAALPMIASSRKKRILKVPDDIASRVELAEELERYAASLRQ